MEGCPGVGAESAAIWASHGRRVTPLPLRLQPGWQLPGAEKEGEGGLGTVDGLSSPLGRDCAARGGWWMRWGVSSALEVLVQIGR